MPAKFSLALMLFLMFNGCRQKVATSSATDMVEAHRPLYHFTPDSMWMNDPNGLVYHDGEYHLFYQYYPDSTVWGPMHWGHAVRRDLMHWEDLPIALYPDSLGLIFSGSCVIDSANTSGFGQRSMVAIFTHHHMGREKAGDTTFQYQSIAWSEDKGRTFKKYSGNPVIANPGIRDFRDPKVSWDHIHKQWVLILAAYDKAMIYTSPDLIHWQESSTFGIPGDTRLWECPDLFPMTVKGSGQTKWVLMVSIQKLAPNGGTATSYFVGDFDGKKFIANPKDQKWLDYGKDNYAFVTWSNLPGPFIRGIGWMSNWQYAQAVPTKKWRSAMTLPRDLTLQKINGSYVLSSMPTAEVFDVFEPAASMAMLSDKPVQIPEACYLDVKWVPGASEEKISIFNQQGDTLIIGCQRQENRIFVDRTKAGESSFSKDFAGKHYGVLPVWRDTLSLRIFLDVASLEVFANNGECSMTEIFFPATPLNMLQTGTSAQNMSVGFRKLK